MKDSTQQHLLSIYEVLTPDAVLSPVFVLTRLTPTITL